MRRLPSVVTDIVELEVGECDCGYHFGVDATYLDQVGDFSFLCPACGKLIYTAQLFPEDHPTFCCICGKPCDTLKAHLHQGQWIGDECCWDERLRASE